MKCRNCSEEISVKLVDLGNAPLSNAYLTEVTLRRPEKWFPLRVLICEQCWLVQAEAYSRSAEIFSEDYAYFSSFSTAWLEHASELCAQMKLRLGLNSESFVVEIGSNDGYLLKNFVREGIRCLGIEPTASTAAAAKLLGIPTLESFFDAELASKIVREHGKAELIVAINVFAHVPHPREFLNGIRELLSSDGVFVVEFPHLVTMIDACEFDTIYHEHFSYFSFTTVLQMFAESGLRVVDVEELTTHGGSLRIQSVVVENSNIDVSPAVGALIQRESDRGIKTIEFYAKFESSAVKIKNNFVSFLIDQHTKGELVVGYGAAAKGNTLLNFAGIKPDLLRVVVDRNPAKVGKFLPGSRIPIVAEAELRRLQPNFVLILPWNLKGEIERQLSYIREWGGKFVIAVPELTVW